ncbi:lipase [Actinoplanes auranticolor]|uniref:lipase n=1 Tax=Actinoplanes auranticolor TaxID=47988 RepID=UPI001BB37790|nr:lipase [Actinoplanes auranticolor]
MRCDGERVSRRLVLAGATGVTAAALLPTAAGAASPAGGSGRGTAGTLGKVRLRLPGPGGPYPVGTVDLHFVDRSRPDPYVAGQPYRELMVNLTYPARHRGGPVAPWLTPGWAAAADEIFAFATAPQPANLVDWAGTPSHAVAGAAAREPGDGWPVLMYQLGHWGSHSTNRSEIEDLASRGYVVVTFEPTHETPVVFPGGRLVPQHPAANPPNDDRYSPEFLAYVRHIYASRTADARFVLDRLAALNARELPGGLRAGLDLGRIGAFSGITGAGLMTLTLMAADERVRAGAIGDTDVGFPTADGGWLPLAPVVEQGLSRAVLAIRPGSAYGAANPMWDRQWSALRGWRRELELAGGGMGWCSDLQTVLPQVRRGLGLPADAHAAMIGTVAPAAAVAATRAYQAAFFDLHLKGRPTRLFSRPSASHPAVRLAR